MRAVAVVGLAAGWLAAGCAEEPRGAGEAAAALAAPGERILRLQQLQLGAVTDEGLLEAEVHLVDATTRALIGCSGALHGMLGVDDGLRPYALNAHFVRPGGIVGYPNPRGEWLTEADVRGREVRAIVLEDDLDACPTPQGASDDLIGTSKPVRLDGLGAPLTVEMESGQVQLLRLGY